MCFLIVPYPSSMTHYLESARKKESSIFLLSKISTAYIFIPSCRSTPEAAAPNSTLVIGELCSVPVLICVCAVLFLFFFSWPR